MMRRAASLAVLALLVLPVLVAPPARAEEPAKKTPAVAAVMGFAAALSQIRTGDPALDARRAALGAAFDRYVAIDQVVPRMLGRYWSDAAPADQKQMRAGMRQYLVQRMSGLAGADAKTPVKVVETSQVPWGQDTLVNAQVELAPGETQKLGFLVTHGADGSARISDIIMKGISATQLLGAQCQALMMNGGGSTALLARLNQ
jgi:ABC-type transporter MlaC component